jgi:hypothetical protein
MLLYVVLEYWIVEMDVLREKVSKDPQFLAN